MRFLLTFMLILWAGFATAQSASDDDRDFLTGLIEDAVSDDNMTVRLIGFKGALSSEATADRITIADGEGVWLQLDALTISWDRSALLSGSLEISTLSAERIELIRLPEGAGEEEAPSAEATPFALPDLPVSVKIDEIAADEIVLTEALLGEPVTARFDGAVELSGGAGDASLLLARTDGKRGLFDIDATFANETRQLTLRLLAEEGQNGIAARMLNIPDRPALRLEISGDAPLDDFTSEIALATDGVDRVTGNVMVSQPSGTFDRAFALDLSGDLRPLMADQYDPFFGANAVLRTEGTLFGIGGLRLSNLTLGTDKLVLRGQARLDADYWPLSFDLRGRLGNADGTAVRLPLGGTPTEVSGMSLDVTFDAEAGDRWTGAFDITGLTREGVSADTLALSGGGTITPGGGMRSGDFTGDLSFAARGIALSDPGLSEAIGEEIEGRVELSRREGAPFFLRNLTLEGAGLEAQAFAVVYGPDARFRTSAEVAIRADDFSRFSTLTGLRLSGAGDISGKGNLQPFDGIFDLNLTAQTNDLAFGIDTIDPLLRGPTVLTIEADRDTTGTYLRALDLTGEALSASGSATLRTGTIVAAFVAELNDLGRVLEGLSGPGTLAADISTDEAGVITLDTTLTAPDARGTAQGTATPLTAGYVLRGDSRISVSNLAPYGRLAGQTLGGQATVDLSGTFETETRVLEADVVAQTQDLRAGSPALTPILAGSGRIAADVSLSEAGRLRLDGLDVTFPNFTAQGQVATSGTDTVAQLTARLRDIALLTSDFSGPVTADVTARQDPRGWQVSGSGEGPAGTNARVSGRVGNDARLDLDVTGSAPLALANLYIAPRQINGLARFDLNVSGPAALGSVRGPVTISDARLAAPNLRQSIEGINGTITLTGGTARLNLSGQSAAGGALRLTGPIDLAPPFQAGLSVEIVDVVLQDPTLYRTTARGAVNVSGPLAGGARITGGIDLGTTEIQVPSSQVSALGTLPEVTHLGPRAEVRQTLARAGVGVTADTAQGPAGPAYPLDLTIRAPSRIFVRGRGLDAELGGQLRLTGTTNAVVPIGRFDLVRGRLDILGQRFSLSEGYAQLQGDFAPYLRLVATTQTTGGTTVNIIVEGPANQIEVRFESTPELPQDEVLAQLLFGRDLGSISPLQAVQLASAVATLAGTGGGGGGVIGNIREGLDLDDFDLTSDEEGNAAVRAGKYLSDNVYTDVTIGANGTSEINLNIDINQNFTARGSVASDGETSIGVFFERDY